MGSTSKRIGSFKEFLEEQRQKRLEENRVSISCDFWDQAIVEVLQEIENQCNGVLVWETIIKFCKDKWAILGRPLPQPEYDDNLLLTQHIKDLIFQFHGTSFYTDWKCDYGWDNQQIHSKGLVIEELAATILEKVKEKAHIQDDVQSDDLSGSLSDKEEVTLIPMKPAPCYDDCEDEYYEDLPFESKSVLGFEKYNKLIEEAKTEFKLVNQQKAIDYTLDRLEQEAGSLSLDDISQVVISKFSHPDQEEGDVMFSKYIKSIVMEYLENKGLVQTLVKKDKNTFISRNVVNGILNLFGDMVVDEVLHILTKKGRKEEEDEEV